MAGLVVPEAGVAATSEDSRFTKPWYQALALLVRRFNTLSPKVTTLYGALTTGLGYASGVGGAVTQITSKATAVTLNKLSGQITMNGAALAATTTVGFTLTNSFMAATDVVLVTIASGGTANSYNTQVAATVAGSCVIELRNTSAASKSEAVVLNFAVFKAVNA